MADLDPEVLVEVSSTVWISRAPQAEGGGLWLSGAEWLAQIEEQGPTQDVRHGARRMRLAWARAGT